MVELNIHLTVKLQRCKQDKKSSICQGRVLCVHNRRQNVDFAVLRSIYAVLGLVETMFDTEQIFQTQERQGTIHAGKSLHLGKWFNAVFRSVSNVCYQ